jgi:N-acetylglucosaminyldiphosphoundecaprenol N-acetyl-beta-D-mannosaminyltransferase
MESAEPDRWPVLSVQVSATDYAHAVRVIGEAADRKLSAWICCANAHTVATADFHLEYRQALNNSLLTVPDGRPIVWALRWLGGPRLPDRVYGPTLMLRLCEAAATAGRPIWLHGGKPGVAEQLRDILTARWPTLNVAGVSAPPFGSRSPEEEAAEVEQIRRSGARLVFAALGAPKQELWAARNAEKLSAIVVAVGAAFDFHTGRIKQAPGWMQRAGLEWFHRLCQEPRRLWRRYLLTNAYFTVRLLGLVLLRPFRRQASVKK